MKSLKQFAGITFFGALACAGLHAQTMDLTATIPFAFTVGRSSMPAGIYKIHGDGAVVALRQVDARTPANVYVMTFGGHAGASTSTPALDFHRYGDRYFLASIKSASAAADRELPQSGPEKELAKRIGSVVEASVIAAKK